MKAGPIVRSTLLIHAAAQSSWLVVTKQEMIAGMRHMCHWQIEFMKNTWMNLARVTGREQAGTKWRSISGLPCRATPSSQ